MCKFRQNNKSFKSSRAVIIQFCMTLCNCVVPWRSRYGSKAAKPSCWTIEHVKYCSAVTNFLLHNQYVQRFKGGQIRGGIWSEGMDVVVVSCLKRLQWCPKQVPDSCDHYDIQALRLRDTFNSASQWSFVSHICIYLSNEMRSTYVEHVIQCHPSETVRHESKH